MPYQAIDFPDVLEDILFIDQSPIGGTSKSFPATYLKFYDHIRNLMAMTPLALKRNYSASFFS